MSGINVLEDYFVILHKEARTNPNYIVGFLSYEKKIVKVDKEKFGIFSPRENEVYKVGKMLTGLKEDERIKVTDITITGFFHRVGEIAKIEDFLEKYKMSVDYPTTDTNNIDPLKINFEEYFLIGFSGSKLVRVNGKIVKQIKGRINNFKFEIDNFEDSIKLVNMRYIGNSLVRIRRTDKVTSFHEVKSFGYFRTEEKFRELIKKKKAGEIKDIASHLYNSSDDSNYQNISNLESKDQNLLNVLIENETVTDRWEAFSYYYNEGTTPVGYKNYENPDDPELEDFFNLMLEDNTFACEDNDYIKIEDDYRNNIFFETWISVNYDGIIYNSMDFKTDLFYLDYSKVDFDIKKISDSKLEILGNLYTRFISKITASDNA